MKNVAKMFKNDPAVALSLFACSIGLTASLIGIICVASLI